MTPVRRPGLEGVGAAHPARAGSSAVRRLDVATGTDGVVPFELLGRCVVGELGTLDVWRIAAYGGGMMSLFSTHPPTAERVARLEALAA